jgi:hypothetical protein
MAVGLSTRIFIPPATLTSCGANDTRVASLGNYRMALHVTKVAVPIG